MLDVGLAITACQAGFSFCFTTFGEWSASSGAEATGASPSGVCSSELAPPSPPSGSGRSEKRLHRRRRRCWWRPGGPITGDEVVPCSWRATDTRSCPELYTFTSAASLPSGTRPGTTFERLIDSILAAWNGGSTGPRTVQPSQTPEPLLGGALPLHERRPLADRCRRRKVRAYTRKEGAKK